MPLTASRYGKGRVRVMRLQREGDHHTPRELDLSVMLTGAFDAAWTAGDNRACVATDSLKNLCDVVAAGNLALGTEGFIGAVAATLLDAYPQIDRVRIEARETRWRRHAFDGVPHGHVFTLDGNGVGYAEIDADRAGAALRSGVRGYTLMKTTGSGWAGFVSDGYRTLPDTDDRIAATAMDATWTWARPPARHEAANDRALAILIAVFGTTYSRGIQDSMHRMGEAVLAEIPEIAEIAFAMPNKHYLPIDLTPFGLENANTLFRPTDEPHGQIEATIGRG